MSNKKPGIIIVGKLPPPYFGPAIATKIILESSLDKNFDLKHLDTRLNKSIHTMGKFQLKKIFFLIEIYIDYIKILLVRNNKIVLIPIAQQTSALYKDSIFILLALIFRKKVILHLRGSTLLDWYKNTNKWNQFYFKYIFRKSSLAVVLGEKLRYIFEFFLPKEKVYVIPNGANYNFVESKIESEKIQILYFSNLLRNKGLDLLLNALKDLSEDLKSKIECKVVGSWDEKKFEEECKNMVQKFNLPVTFLNSVFGDRKLSLFLNSDIFVFTPRAPEGHPWVIIEAMAAGLPIISSDKGAITESVIDNENGFIVDTNDHKELTKKLTLLIENQKLRAQMSLKSKSNYYEKFTEEIMILKLNSLFYNILKSN